MKSLANNIFFGIIALFVISATTFQFIMVVELTDQCGDEDVITAPLLSGVALASSFIFNALWLYGTGRCVCRGKKTTPSDNIRRVALLFWTTITTVGVTSAGAALGQIKLYAAACPNFSSEVNIEALQYISIILLILSIAVPHAFSKKKAGPATDDTSGMTSGMSGAPETNEYVSKTGRKRLVFI